MNFKRTSENFLRVFYKFVGKMIHRIVPKMFMVLIPNFFGLLFHLATVNPDLKLQHLFSYNKKYYLS